MSQACCFFSTRDFEPHFEHLLTYVAVLDEILVYVNDFAVDVVEVQHLPAFSKRLRQLMSQCFNFFILAISLNNIP